jgi:hypothetical protein
MANVIRYMYISLAAAAVILASCDDEEVRAPYGGPWKITKTPPEVHGTVSRIQFLDENNGWATAGDYLLRLKGKEWVAYKRIVHPDPSSDYGFADFHLLNEKEGWFVGIELVPDPRGGGRTIRHSMIWRYEGGKFTPVEHPDKGWLGTVWFNNPNDGWALGYGALHYRNGEWEEVELKAVVRDCFFFGEDDGWAVSSGSIWRWDGVTWTRVAECGNFEYFNCIAFNRPRLGWAGLGEGFQGYPHMFHYDGGEWDYYQDGFADDVWDIDFSGPDYGCAVGIGASVFKNGEWVYTADPKGVFWCVECVGPDDIWAGSDAGDIYHFTGFN